jgi:disulfide bond formation protein DsbB
MMDSNLRQSAPLLVILGSVAALGTALLSQYWGGLVPCELCIAQRWPYGVAILLGLLALLMPGNRARGVLVALAALAFAVDAGIALFHAGFEYGWWQGPTACTAPSGAANTLDALRAQLAAAPVVACDRPQWTFHGISMAGFNFTWALLLFLITAASAGHLVRRP